MVPAASGVATGLGGRTTAVRPGTRLVTGARNERRRALARPHTGRRDDSFSTADHEDQVTAPALRTARWRRRRRTVSDEPRARRRCTIDAPARPQSTDMSDSEIGSGARSPRRSRGVRRAGTARSRSSGARDARGSGTGRPTRRSASQTPRDVARLEQLEEFGGRGGGVVAEAAAARSCWSASTAGPTQEQHRPASRSRAVATVGGHRGRCTTAAGVTPTNTSGSPIDFEPRRSRRVGEQPGLPGSSRIHASVPAATTGYGATARAGSSRDARGRTRSATAPACGGPTGGTRRRPIEGHQQRPAARRPSEVLRTVG